MKMNVPDTTCSYDIFYAMSEDTLIDFQSWVLTDAYLFKEARPSLTAFSSTTYKRLQREDLFLRLYIPIQLIPPPLNNFRRPPSVFRIPKPEAKKVAAAQISKSATQCESRYRTPRKIIPLRVTVQETISRMEQR